ncbi:hypothetical protein NEHOM01_1917 [Nematocida homosporus]|uniref:uncharacterized protein n=1 Tax=Nematocida homosporus TaxID=1912981 RepID=UPI00221FC020|nr:uncharacterized protein NEHOM01_1917 [Nematocida homosporus]KAI5187084.1 hypothetical protein NEHOM01_1917 [Nematocida homosporus]
MITGLPLLKSIQIGGIALDSDQINLHLWIYHNRLEPIEPNTNPMAIAIPYKVLYLLYTHCEKIEQLIPNHKKFKNTPIERIVAKLVKDKCHGDKLDCSICHNEIFAYSMLMTDTATEQNNRAISLLKAVSAAEVSIVAVWFFECGHCACIKCMYMLVRNSEFNDQIEQCPYCKQSVSLRCYNQLVYISSIIANSSDGYACNTTTNTHLSSATTRKDDQYLFYLPYENPANLIRDLNTTPSNNFRSVIKLT